MQHLQSYTCTALRHWEKLVLFPDGPSWIENLFHLFFPFDALVVSIKVEIPVRLGEQGICIDKQETAKS